MEDSRLSIRSVAFAAAILWGGAILIVHTAHWIWPDYGTVFLQCVSSVYPGYDGVPGVGSLIRVNNSLAIEARNSASSMGDLAAGAGGAGVAKEAGNCSTGPALPR